MENKYKILPELCFPGFDKEGEWVKKELNEFCFNISSGKDKNSENGVFVLYGSTGIIGRTENGSYDGKYILVARVGANAGLLNLVKGKFGVTDNTLVIDLKEVNLFDYIFYILETIGLNKLVFGSGQPLITGRQLKNLIINYPLSIINSSKIASCLSSLDELLAAHSQKLEALKEHKKGLMQNLFPQEGETVPNYRFPEFAGDGEWVEKKLNYYLELLTDFEANGSFADVKANVTVYDEPNFAWYVRATDLEKKSDLESVKYVDEHSYNFLNKTKLFGGELLITKRGEIGKVYIYMPFKNLPATVAPNMYLLKLNEKAEPKFFYYHFTNNKGNQTLKRLNASSTIGALYKDDVKNISVLVPALCEQQKIASCLSSLDALITAQSEKIEQLKLHKKGLMQGLFPKSITNE